MAHIWRRMVGLYGHKWGSQYGRAINEKKQLSGLAKDWQRGLAGITPEQLRVGFASLEASILREPDESWPPSWPVFRKLCLSNIMADMPTLDEIVTILAMVSSRQGSMAKRYKHPLALAVSRHEGVDMFSIRTAKPADAKRMIKPAYEQCLKSGWSDWTDDELKEPDSKQKALGHDKSRNKAIGASAFSAIRAAL
ncbi:MAG: hypothetical protein ACXV8I_00110 [Methylobacter sp.]